MFRKSCRELMAKPMIFPDRRGTPPRNTWSWGPKRNHSDLDDPRLPSAPSRLAQLTIFGQTSDSTSPSQPQHLRWKAPSEHPTEQSVVDAGSILQQVILRSKAVEQKGACVELYFVLAHHNIPLGCQFMMSPFSTALQNTRRRC